MEIHLRALIEADEPYIYATWLRQYADAAFAKRVPTDVYHRNHRVLIRRLLEGATTAVLYSPEYPEDLIGWVSFERLGAQDLVHFASLRAFARGHGIMRSVFAKLELGSRQMAVSHETPAWKRFARGRYHYNPYLMFEEPDGAKIAPESFAGCAWNGSSLPHGPAADPEAGATPGRAALRRVITIA